MPTIIKKGTNSSAFQLRSGKKIVIKVGDGGGDFLNILTDAEYAELMKEYGNFIEPRIISDKNPNGCFIISNSSAHAQGFAAEVGDEIKDNSAQIEIDAASETPVIEVVEPEIEAQPEESAAEVGDEIKDNSASEEKSEEEEKSKKARK